MVDVGTRACSGRLGSIWMTLMRVKNVDKVQHSALQLTRITVQLLYVNDLVGGYSLILTGVLLGWL